MRLRRIPLFEDYESLHKKQDLWGVKTFVGVAFYTRQVEVRTKVLRKNRRMTGALVTPDLLALRTVLYLSGYNNLSEANFSGLGRGTYVRLVLPVV